MNTYPTNNWAVNNLIHTPAVVIDEQTLMTNIKRMSDFAKQYGVKLRPHFKTHKTLSILQQQIHNGAIGVTVAKISEAESIVTEWEKHKNETNLSSINKLSILIAFPIIGEANYERILKLQRHAHIIVMVDHEQQLEALHAFAQIHDEQFNVSVKINSGLNRCGLEPDHSKVVAFVQKLLRYEHLHFQGIMTHAGQSYGAPTNEERIRIGMHEGELMAAIAKQIKEHIPSLAHTFEVSVGSTPTVYTSGTVQGVTEIRPGNYVFNDSTQVHLGTTSWEHCALRVFSRVVSKPTENRWVIDAGSKTLALDQGAHGQKGLSGFGAVVGEPHLTISRLSEEHGVLEGVSQQNLQIGDVIQIIPNHACPVVNLTDKVFVFNDEQQSVTEWPVIGRGKNY